MNKHVKHVDTAWSIEFLGLLTVFLLHPLVQSALFFGTPFLLARYGVYHMLISALPSIAPRLDRLRNGTMQVPIGNVSSECFSRDAFLV